MSIQYKPCSALIQVRGGKRRSRVRQRKSVYGLRQRVLECRQRSVEVTQELQQVTQKVSAENAKLQALLTLMGVPEAEVKGFMTGPEVCGCPDRDVQALCEIASTEQAGTAAISVDGNSRLEDPLLRKNAGLDGRSKKDNIENHSTHTTTPTLGHSQPMSAS